MTDKIYVGKKSPLRDYVSVDGTTETWLKTSVTQRLQLIAVGAIAILLRSFYVNKYNFLFLEELKMGKIINSYNTGEFFFDLNPPLVGLIYTFIASKFGYNQYNMDSMSLGVMLQSFPLANLRLVSSILSSIAIIFAYRCLRATGVSHLISLFGVFMLTIENSMVTHHRLLLNDGVFVLFLSLFLSAHKVTQLYPIFGFKWLINVLVTSISLGFAFSSHWIGLFLLAYAIFSLTLELWNSSSNVRLSLKYIWFNYFFKMVSYLSISITIYLTIYKIHFNLLNQIGPDYNLLSPQFQYSLDGNHLERSTPYIGYGSKVMLRHYSSGRYLHSHDDKYMKTGHQQVTGFNSFDDLGNMFQLFPVKGNIEKQVEQAAFIKSPFRVNLKHIDTDSSLIIDGNAKPPLSEQEYNMQVTTDKNFEVVSADDENARNDANKRLTFTLKLAHKYCNGDEAKRTLKLVDSVFQVYNEQNSCYLLASSLLMHDGFSEGQNEMICIKEPDFESSLWYIDWNENARIPSNVKPFKMEQGISFLQKFVEVHYLILKKIFIGEVTSTKANEIIKITIKDWIFMRRGYTHLIFAMERIIIYLLGNIIIYYSVLICLFGFAVFKAFQILTFNPFKLNTETQSIDQSLYKYELQITEYVLGFLSLLIPMVFVKIQLNSYTYIPALFFGILIIAQSLQLVYEKCPKTSVLIILLSSILMILAFNKFAPLIYGLSWSKEKCEKLLVFPTWDSQLCRFYEE